MARTQWTEGQQLSKSRAVMEDRVQSVHRRSGYPVDELRSVANETFMAATRQWDGSAGGAAFTTYLYRALSRRLWYHVNRFPLADAEEPDLSVFPSQRHEWNPNWTVHFQSWVLSLSSEARFVLSLILSAPTEAFGVMARSPRAVRGALSRFLRLERGWTKRRITAVYSEIRSSIREEL